MIEIEDQNPIAIVRLKHGKVNALDLEFCQALTSQFEQLAEQGIGGCVVTSATGVFSAGVNLKRLIAEPPDYVDPFLNALTDCFQTLFEFQRPVVAAINGHAVAGGCVLACACDHRILDSRSMMGVPELRVGVPFPPIAMEIMRHVASGTALHSMVHSGQTFRHQAAIEAGLAHEISSPDDVLSRAIASAKQMATIPPDVFSLTKQQLRRAAINQTDDSERRYGDRIRALWKSETIREQVEQYVKENL